MNVNIKHLKAILILYIISSQLLSAQVVNAYQFTQNSTSLSVQPSTGVATLITSGQGDLASSIVNIGFSFVYGGVGYSQFSVSSNGLMALGATKVTNSGTNAAATNLPYVKIMPWWENTATGNSASGGGVRTWSFGTSPNRVKVIDFKLNASNNATLAYNLNYQVWLHESTGQIQFIYGPGSIVGQTATVGISDQYNYLLFKSVTPGSPASVSNTANNAVSTVPHGVSYSFQPSLTPLTGTKIVGASPSDFTTLTEAVRMVNWFGVGLGGVILSVKGGHIETMPPGGLCVEASGTASNQIVIQWNGTGAKPILNAGVGTTTDRDFILGICGSDYVTIEGMKIMDPATNTTITTKAEIGIGLFKRRYNTTLGNDGCHHVTIKNNEITLTRLTNTWKYYSGTQHNFFTAGIKAYPFTSKLEGDVSYIWGGNPNKGILSEDDVHHDCLIVGNTIDNCTYGIAFNDRWKKIGSTYIAGFNNRIGQLGLGNTVTNYGFPVASTFAVSDQNRRAGKTLAGITIGGQKEFIIEYNTVSTGTTNTHIYWYNEMAAYAGILAGNSSLDGQNFPQNAPGFFAKINNNIVSGLDVKKGAQASLTSAYGIAFAQNYWLAYYSGYISQTSISGRSSGNVEINNNTISGIVVERGDCAGISMVYPTYQDVYNRVTSTAQHGVAGFRTTGDVSIKGNTIKAMTHEGISHDRGSLYGIFWNQEQNNLLIENNSIGGAGSDGLFFSTASANIIYGHGIGTRAIYVNTPWNSMPRNEVRIQGNTIDNVDNLAGTPTGGNLRSRGFSGIFLKRGALLNVIQGNIIKNCDLASGPYSAEGEINSISLIYAEGTPFSGTSTLEINTNTITGNTRNKINYYGADWGQSAPFVGIDANLYTTRQVKKIKQNIIDGMTNSAISSTNSHLYYARIEGIRVRSYPLPGSTVEISGNTIKNLGGAAFSYNSGYSANSSYNFSRSFNVLGINVMNYNRLKIKDNNICTLSTTATGPTTDGNIAQGVIGINWGGQSPEHWNPRSSKSDPRSQVTNNFISDLTAPAIRSRLAVVGAAFWGWDVARQFEHNTIALGSTSGSSIGRITSSGLTFGVTGFLDHSVFYNNRNHQLTFANNIISINADTKGTGMGTAWRHYVMHVNKRMWLGIDKSRSGNVYFVNDDANNYIYGQGIQFNTTGGIRNCYGYGPLVTTNTTYNLVNDNLQPKNFNVQCGKYKSFAAGRELLSFIDLDASNVMKPIPFVGVGTCPENLKISNGATSYVGSALRIGTNGVYPDVANDYFATSRGTSKVTSGAHENNANITGTPVDMISFEIAESLCDLNVCGGTQQYKVYISPPDGRTIATATNKKPRLYFRRIQNNSLITAAQSDANVMVNSANNNATGTEGWRWVEATSIAGALYTFNVDESLLKNNITTSVSYTIEFFVIAETADGVACSWTSGDFSTNCPTTVDLHSVGGATMVPADYDSDTAINDNSVDDRYSVVNGSSMFKKTRLFNNETVYSTNMTTALSICAGDSVRVAGMFANAADTISLNPDCVDYMLEVADDAAFSVNLSTIVQPSDSVFTYYMANTGTKYFRVWLVCGTTKVNLSNTPYVFVTATPMPVNTSVISDINSCEGKAQNLTLSSSTPTINKNYFVANPLGKIYVVPPVATTSLTKSLAFTPTSYTETGIWHSYVCAATGVTLNNSGVKASSLLEGTAYNTNGGSVDTTAGVAFTVSKVIKLDAVSIIDEAEGTASAGFNVSLYHKSGALLYKTAAQTAADGQLKQIALGWIIPPGDYLLIMGASTVNTEPTGGLAKYNAEFPRDIPNSGTPAIRLLGGVSNLDFDNLDEGTGNYFVDWDVTTYCTSNDVTFNFDVNPATCCDVPPPTVGLINNNTISASLVETKCTNISGNWRYYFDPAAPTKLLCAVEPNGNDWNPSEVMVTNSYILSDTAHVRTDSADVWTEVMPYMLTIVNSDELTINGGVKVRFFYPSAQKSAIDTRRGKKAWFKHPGSKPDILELLQQTGLPGREVLAISSTGTENNIPYVQFDNVTSFSTFGYMGTDCVSSQSATITATDNSCTLNDKKVVSGDTVTLTASTGIDYLWSTGNTTRIIKATPTVSTTYTVTVTDSDGCTSVISETISITTCGPCTSPVQATITVTENSCTADDKSVLVGGEATLTASTGTAFSWSNDANTATIQVSPAVTTTYSVTVTDEDGCTSTTSETITIQSPPPANAATLAACPSIQGGTVASFNLGAQDVYDDITNTTPGYTLTFHSTLAHAQTGQNSLTTSYNGGSSTIYVRVEGPGSDCFNTTTLSLTVLSSPLVDAAGTDVSCYGGSTGSALATGSGGLAPYTYLWSTSATGASVGSLIAGTYTVTITDSNGCTGNDDVTISQPSPFLASVTNVTNVQCGGSNSGAIDISVSGGKIPYIYAWSNSLPGVQDPANLATGTYTVTVTDDNGCTATTSAMVTEAASSISATVSMTSPAFCNNPTGQLSAVGSGGTSPYTYAWSTTPAITISTAGSLYAGTYIVIVTDANGCTGTGQGTVTATVAPVISFANVTNVSCLGGSDGSATASINSGTGQSPFAFAWSTGSTASNITSPSEHSISALAKGLYSVTVTDGNGCIGEGSIIINEPTALTYELTVVKASCNGVADGYAAIVAAGGSSPYSYLWSNSVTANSMDTLSAKTYSVTVTDSKGCTNTASVVIEAPALLSVTASQSSPVLCFGATTGSLGSSPSGGTPPFSYEWTSPANDIQNPTGVASGMYQLVVTDSNGCTASSSATITQPAVALQAETTGTDVACAGGSSGSVSVAAMGGTSPYTYNWSSGQSTITAAGLVAGSYTVLVTDANSCTATAMSTISMPEVISVSLTLQMPLSCAGVTDGAATISVSGGVSPYSYLWSSGETTSAASALAGGAAAVTVTDANGCTAVKTLTITSPQAIQLQTSAQRALCLNAATGSATVTVTGGTSPYTYYWSDGQSAATASTLAADSYSVTVTDANGCTASSSVTVAGPPSFGDPEYATWLALDCDGDGDPNVTDPDPDNPCVFTTGSVANTTNPVWSAADCDGDGENNGIETTNGTDPKDPCDYTTAPTAASVSWASWSLLDCDGDGSPNVTDPQPLDPCTSDTGAVPNPANAVWAGADCDSDGETNGFEYNKGTNPSDPCIYTTAPDATSDIWASWSLLDCDGDGSPNGVDPQPLDPCSSATGATPDPGNVTWSAADCDGDGETNGYESNQGTDPNDPCDYTNSGNQNSTNLVWAAADCDSDGETNGFESSQTTDPFDPCDYTVAPIAGSQAWTIWSALDCDGDGESNGTDPAPLNACQFSSGHTPPPSAPVCAVKIGNLVWHDVDNDGVQETGDTGINGVNVSLIWAGPDGDLATVADNQMWSVVSGPAGGFDTGEYYFDAPETGLYKLIFTTPSTYVPTKRNIGNVWDGGDTDSDAGSVNMNLSSVEEVFTITSLTNVKVGENGIGDNATTLMLNILDSRADESHDAGFWQPCCPSGGN